ncbi:heavy-metal-associated domain-containing protein [Flavobacteriaceae bacterium]|nr:heavy-metal-associated domain-containing protein [Flavobacteriaceae bacterium]
METTIKIQNLKCGGCAATIVKKINEIDGVSNTLVNVETSEVSYTYTNKENLEVVKNKLSAIGYPLEDEENTILKKANSYVSCAIGKIQK